MSPQGTCSHSGLKVALKVFNLDESPRARKLRAGGGPQSLEQMLVENVTLRCRLEHANILMMFAAFKVRDWAERYSTLICITLVYITLVFPSSLL